ncbi:hypothetical protein [uncultured Desulfovibrio sp.]|uniref:hypothetical protein n=1 Tax=uncultured Desulfovibrio sp. TaxID=167968 RepID=UPI00260DC344|nr:hypothetical protein [uncultured Desulfovibrio sp.]
MFLPDIRLRRIRRQTERFLPLLRLADDEPAHIDAWLARGTLYGLFVRRREPVSLAVLTDETAAFAPDGPRVRQCSALRGKRVVECRLLVTAPAYRRRGLARQLLMRLCGLLDTTYDSLLAGTGAVPRMDSFYRGSGFAPCFALPHFFRDNSPAPIVEDGVLLDDMQYYVRHIGRAEPVRTCQ